MGRIEYRSGEIYQGEFEKGKRVGRGTILEADGNSLYSGTWKNG